MAINYSGDVRVERNKIGFVIGFIRVLYREITNFVFLHSKT